MPAASPDRGHLLAPAHRIVAADDPSGTSELTVEATGSSPQPLRGPINEADRQACAERLRTACAAGQLTFEEFSGRMRRVWLAHSTADLGRAGLDPSEMLAGSAIDRTSGQPVKDPDQLGASDDHPARIVSLIGDGRRFGRWRVTRRTLIVNVLGTWTLDLRGALLTPGVLARNALEIRFVSLIGDLVVSVPDGVAVEVSGRVLLGDRRLALAVIPEVPGTPRLRLRLMGIIGDVRVISGSMVGRPDRAKGRQPASVQQPTAVEQLAGPVRPPDRTAGPTCAPHGADGADGADGR